MSGHPAAASVLEITGDFERWLATVVDVVPHGLEEKHQAMAQGELPFLRGSYYLWLLRVAERLPDVLTHPRVPIVGDLHVENFGTWRDTDQVRRWGVNDLDELATGPWLLDLLRLATSASVAPHIHLEDDELARVILDSYAGARPRAAVDLTAADTDHLRHLVPPFKDPGTFYAHLADGPPASVPEAVARAAAAVAEPGWTPTWHEHEAGTGSLGHRRAVGVGPAADGTPHAREAKQLGPGTAAWAATRIQHAPTPADLYAQVVRWLRGPAGATRVAGWQVRDLAPDAVRIELSGLPAKDGRHLLRSMAQAVADVHGSHAAAATRARDDAGRLHHGEFLAMVTEMAKVTRDDAAEWRAGLGGHLAS